VPVEIFRPTWHVGPNFWLTGPFKIVDEVVVAQTLFDADALHSYVRVLNLMDRPFDLHKGQLFGMASKVEVCGPVPSLQVVGVDSNPDAISGMAARSVTQEDVEQAKCLTEALPAELLAEEHAQAIKFICDNAGVFSKGEFDIGRTHLVEHAIETSDNRSRQQALCRHPVAYLPLTDMCRKCKTMGSLNPG